MNCFLPAELPYFLTREEWYTYDINNFIYVLTDAGKAIPEVVKSYEEFYRLRLPKSGEVKGSLSNRREPSSPKTNPRKQ